MASDGHGGNTKHAGAGNVPDSRLGEQGQSVGVCRECGAELGAGYLCDTCDTVEVHR